MKKKVGTKGNVAVGINVMLIMYVKILVSKSSRHSAVSGKAPQTGALPETAECLDDFETSKNIGPLNVYNNEKTS